MGTASPNDVVSSEEWMEWFLDTTEADLLCGESRWRFLDTSGPHPMLVNPKTGKQWSVGTFQVKSVAELAATLQPSVQGAKPAVPLRVADRVDIGELQAKSTTEDRVMVQIASNFNCLEVPSRGCDPQHGRLVSNYAVDATQGPAASFGVPAASLWRAHYCFHDPAKPVEDWGQTLSNQVELLGEVTSYYGQCINGKATFTGEEKSLPDSEVEVVSYQIRVGIHEDAEVVFGRGFDVFDIKTLNPPAKVDQVLSASLNWRSLGVTPPDDGIDNLTRAALRAAYNGAYLAAIHRKRRKLLLTAIGGGVFENPMHMIWQEIARAHRTWANHPSSDLEEVILCLYTPGSAEPAQRSLDNLLASS